MMCSMLLHVARASLEAAVGAVALVSSDPDAAELCSRVGIPHVSDSGLPWNEGMVHAREALESVPEAVLYLAADLPQVSAEEIRALAASVERANVGIGRAHDGGTNALAVRPADALWPMFGVPGSAAVHAAAARAAGLEATILDLSGVALDVDTPEDARRAGLL
jgi:2-phospho-L-lactate guanylyltransferase